MPNVHDFPAKGRIKQGSGDTIVFQPSGTNYELHLHNGNGTVAGPIDKPVEAIIYVTARRLWTVASGGNFVSPIFGPPRTIQGTVKWLDEQTLVVHAGTNFAVQMPALEAAVDLACGPIAVGTMVNVTAMPEVRIELRGGGGAPGHPV